tara:strand:+ start:294 stop:635 length:342 start_codon:yes stop_codon:yes gene_type:complete
MIIKEKQHGEIKMALEIDYNTNFGILCRDAICVIFDTRCYREIDSEGNKIFPVEYNGKIYANAEAYADDASPVGGFNGKFLMDTSSTDAQYNVIKQCYLDLKTKDGFTDGIDC